MVLEIKTAYVRVRRYGVDAFFPSGTEQLQCRHFVHLQVVELGRGRGRRDISAVGHDRIVVGDGGTIEVDEDGAQKLTVLQDGISLQTLVDGLNALGIGPRDMISILQTIKAAGALQAEIEVI